MNSTVVMVLVGLAVTMLVAGVSMALSRSPGSVAEQRLDDISGRRKGKSRNGSNAARSFLRAQAIDIGQGKPKKFNLLPSGDAIFRLYEQADLGLEFKHFLYIDYGLMAFAAVAGFAVGLPIYAAPVVALVMGGLPFMWLMMRKKKRVKNFTTQMPDALELVGRALRAGHGLASGLHMVAEEMPSPISVEFGRVFEEQNLGIPIEDALRGMSERVPTMDVRFFVTAVVIQRATGGDLAEVLDKIGRIIRERFQIMGQVAALTGEGRLSGAVLLAMPPALLGFTYVLNREYVSLLFSTTMGTKMLAFAGILQLVGAVAIKKIISIKV